MRLLDRVFLRKNRRVAVDFDRAFSLFNEARTPLRVLLRVSFALICAAISLLLVKMLEPLLGRAYYFPALASILVVAAVAGTRYAVLATAILPAGYAFLFQAGGARTLADVVAYSLAGVVVALVGGSLRAAHTRLDAQNQQLHMLYEQREDFIRTMTHDLRSALSVILAHSGMLSRHEQGPEVLRRARVISRSAKHAADMLRDLVDTVQAESGHLPLQPKPVDLAALTTDLQERFAETAGTERIQVTVPDGLPPVQVDPPLFERVIENLLTNALKYAPASTPVVLGAAPDDGHVIVSVSDQGPGIAESDLPHIFEKYYRASDARAQQGLGLGLYITRLLVEAHGGRIWVKTALGEGTTFYVEVPAAEGRAEGQDLGLSSQLH